MGYAPFDTRLVATRLKEQAPLLRAVLGAADYAAVKSLREFAAPCAYVLFSAEEAGQRLGNGLKAQAVSADFGVALAVRNYREQRGEQVHTQLRDVLEQVRGALIGWVPAASGASAVRLEGGAVMDYDDSTLLWVEAYSLTHVLQR